MNVENELRRRDAARSVPDELVDGPRARATLTALMDGTPPPAAARSRARRRARPVWAAATVGVAGVAAVAAVVGTGLTSGPTSGPTTPFGSWTATGKVANAAETPRWSTSCLRLWNDPEMMGGRHGYRTRLVEERGTYAYVLVVGDRGYQANCLETDNGPKVEMTGGGESVQLAEPPARNGLATGGVGRQDGEHGASWFDVHGRTGSDVAKVDLLTGGEQVHATIEDGYFVAWWPSRVTGGESRNPRVRITEHDGTTRVARMSEFVVPQ